MKTWVVRFLSLLVFNIVVLLVIGWLTPARVGFSAFWGGVILTAAGHDTQREKAMTLGATDFMTKPFSPKRLLHRTAELAGVDYEPDSRTHYEPDPRN